MSGSCGAPSSFSARPSRFSSLFDIATCPRLAVLSPALPSCCLVGANVRRRPCARGTRRTRARGRRRALREPVRMYNEHAPPAELPRKRRRTSVLISSRSRSSLALSPRLARSPCACEQSYDAPYYRCTRLAPPASPAHPIHRPPRPPRAGLVWRLPRHPSAARAAWRRRQGQLLPVQAATQLLSTRPHPPLTGRRSWPADLSLFSRLRSPRLASLDDNEFTTLARSTVTTA